VSSSVTAASSRAASRVACVGILVADIFVPPLTRLPAAGELVTTGDFLLAPGGCAANSAIALARLGVPAAVCGRVGDDFLGEMLVRDLRGRGIDTESVSVTEGLGTSKTVIVPVRGEDRRYIHTFGANVALSVGDIPPGLLEHAEVIYLGGYLLLPGLREDELLPRLRTARAAGARIVLDVAVPSDHPAPFEALRALLPLADYFVPNEDEAFALTGERAPRDQADVFRSHGAQTVVIKRGERGIHVLTADADAFDLPAPQVDVVEPSGAGDAFAAGLIVGIQEGWELERSLGFACVVGGSACTALGCTAGVFSRPEAEEFNAAHPLRAVRVSA
jgi:sugar/nucleoside kinase (ribokinase family)